MIGQDGKIAPLPAEQLPESVKTEQELHRAQIHNLLNPQAKTEFEAWQKQNPNARVEDFLKAQSENKTGNDFEQFYKDYLTENNTPDSAHARTAARKEWANASKANPTINVNAGIGVLDRESMRFAKTHEKAVTDANTQLDKIADARAMINGTAASQALGIPKVLTALVSGAGSGVRITQAELNSIAHARGIEGDFEGAMNRLSGKGTLTRTQQQQLSQILDDVRNRVSQKQQISNDALDRINGAGNREEIIQADKEARQKLNGMEKGSPSSGKSVSLKAAMALPANKGKSEADVRKDIENHGHTVTE